MFTFCLYLFDSAYTTITRLPFLPHEREDNQTFLPPGVHHILFCINLYSRMIFKLKKTTTL